MAYRVEYGNNPKLRVPGNQRKWFKAALIASGVIAGVALAWYGLQAVELQNLLPGNPAVTGAALDTMVDNLQKGHPAIECFTAFCEEIVSHAQFLE